GWIEALVRKRAGTVYQKLRDEGFMTLLLMRLVPIFPYNVLNYASGLAGLRLRDYLLATFIGTIPGIFIYTYLADALRAGALDPKQAFLRILFAGILLAALAVATRLMSGRVRRRLEE
ncbi:MAG TPA: VTT domain-containing protein, partial [Thermoanaerobaculia bacterium]|nr:VTT domain-containing protein [Thermoanaerobaculia bacterium]